MTQPTLLILDDDPAFARAAGRLAFDEGCRVQIAGTLREARDFVRNHSTDLVLLDLGLPDGSGLELLDDLDLSRHGQIAVVTGKPTVESAMRAIAAPVVEYLVKPFRPEQLQSLIRRTVQRHWPRQPDGAWSADALLGSSVAIRTLRDAVLSVASSGAPVLLAGETGTGRENVARAIHDASGRKGPFLMFDCGARTADELAKELFGDDGQGGLLARAGGGTLLLHEVTGLPRHAQARLLAVIERAAPGGAGAGETEPRLLFSIADSAVRGPDMGLREDFYYAIAGLTLRVPPLRERGEDVVVLADLFIDRLNTHYGQARRLAPGTEQALLGHDWPGNLRELRGAVQRAFLLQRSDLLRIVPVAASPAMRDPRASTIPFTVGTTLAELERRAVLATLDHFGNDKPAAARALGISVRTVYNHLARSAASTDDPESEPRPAVVGA